MNPSRILTLLLAAVLVLGGIAYGVTRGGDGDTPGQEPPTVPAPEIETDLVGMSSDLRVICLQAQRLSDYLATIDLDDLRRRHADVRARLAGASPALTPTLERAGDALAEQIRLAEALVEQRDHFEAETQALISSLGTIRAEVVRVAVSSESDAAGRVRRQVGDARGQLRAITDALAEQERAVSAAPAE